MNNNNNEELISLHKYFIISNINYENFKKSNNLEKDFYIYMWYWTLYVLIEWWKELGLKDDALYNLLKEEDFIKLLKRFRNGAFHYQKKYYDNKFINTFKTDVKFVNWVNYLQKEFSYYFLKKLKNEEYI